MKKYYLTVPAMGEGIKEIIIIKWLKNEGDIIKENDIILEIATDKVDTEIHSPVNGILLKILFTSKEEVKIGVIIAIIDISKYENNNLIKDEKNELDNNNKFYSPLVLSIAKKEGIKIGELKNINGTGKNNRITKDDLLEYLKNDNNINKKVYKNVKFNNIHNVSEIIEMDRMRKIISNNMIKSKNTAVHVTSFVETDVTDIVLWREKNKKNFKKENGIKLSFMPFFISAVIKSIKDYPMINISIKDNIILKIKNINIGIAIALPDGNLIVPVIKNADIYNLKKLAIIINDLVKRAKSNNLKTFEIQDGTYTITNIGSFGNILGTPIINQPQVAIIAMGVIKKKPSVIETSKGDFIGIRYKMYISHSYDHRIIDGNLGGSFAKSVGYYLENFYDNFDFKI